MPDVSSLNNLKIALAALDQQYNSTYITPEAIFALRKTLKSFNITTTDWNTLITYTNVTGSTLKALYSLISNLVDAIDNMENDPDSIARALKELRNELDRLEATMDSVVDLTHTTEFATTDLSNVKDNGGVIIYSDNNVYLNTNNNNNDNNDINPKLTLGQNSSSQGEGVIIQSEQPTLVLGG